MKPVPKNVTEAVESAWQSALEGELGGWEIALIEKRITEAAENERELSHMFDARSCSKNWK
jgi:hypothetical protein